MTVYCLFCWCSMSAPLLQSAISADIQHSGPPQQQTGPQEQSNTCKKTNQ